MTLPASGQISMSQVRTELSASGQISLGQSQVRSLAGIASGQIAMSNLWGKSAVTTKYRPTVVSFVTGGSGSSHSADASAYDVVSGYETSLNTTTYASLDSAATLKGTTTDITATYSAFQGTYSYTPGQVYAIGFRLDAISETADNSDLSMTANSYIVIEYSLDNGGSWTTGLTYANGATSGGAASTSVSLGTSVTISSLKVRVTLYSESVWDGINLSSLATASASLKLYDILLL